MNLVTREVQDHTNLMEELQNGSPVIRYWWHRKQREVINLLTRHLKEFSEIEASKLEQPLFVDIGCGSGRDLKLYRHLFQEQGLSWNFLGIDINETNIEQLKRDSTDEGIDWMASNIAKGLPFPEKAVDIVYCSEVIEHLVDPEFFFSEVKRVLKPNGYLLLTTPNEPNVFQRSYWNRDRKAYFQQVQKDELEQSEFQFTLNGEIVNAYGHISVRTIADWETALQQFGFKCIDYRRGSATYGSSTVFNHSWILATFFLIEALLDSLPTGLTRHFSSQLIGLYRAID